MQENTNQVTEEDLSEFVGKNKIKYLYKFSKFRIRNNRFALTWHWPAFFFGPFWFLYRKLYLWAALSLVFVSIGGFLVQLACGICANYIYYLDCRKKIQHIKSCNPEHSTAEALREAGGVHRWVLWNSIALVLIFTAAGFYFHDSFLKNTKIYHQEIIIKEKPEHHNPPQTIPKNQQPAPKEI
ncbi:DUF2628 domain-containing protein [Maridesulfovibrio bastinii]|uniref:DUF2628 domain-containing protein n=1 Tax=Maridesulfovibrio bastinii TaxID=47157 RepID=UPI0003F86AFC|nr:DUF2628 domain-containing protein [Maridesulfovibrio bastinii]